MTSMTDLEHARAVNLTEGAMASLLIAHRRLREGGEIDEIYNGSTHRERLVAVVDALNEVINEPEEHDGRE